MTVTLVLALATGHAGAQSADSGACFGFSFGAWAPALDLARAGHGQPPPADAQLRAPGGRDWASDAMPNDTTLLLFPAWWPAGIQATLPRRPHSAADTVVGQAMAFVADGRVAAPRATLRAWRVACR